LKVVIQTGYQPAAVLGIVCSALLGLGLALLPGTGNTGPEPLTVVVIGDVLPGVRYDTRTETGEGPFRNLAPWLSRADIAAANLEGPLTARGVRVQGKKFTFRVPPTRARWLVSSGLDVLGLANNHVLDYGPVGLTDTIETLSRYGLLWCGAGRNLVEARRPAMARAGAGRVAFLAYSLTYPRSYYATASRPGTVYGDATAIREDVAAARKNADVVIVMMHWSKEKSHELRQYQRPLATAAVEAGAALVIGAHPHVMQGVERIGSGVAAYSLGDAVFGGALRRTEDSLLLRAVFSGGTLNAVEFFALQTSNVDTEFAPRIRTGEDAGPALKMLADLSAGLGCVLKLGRSAEGTPCASLALVPGATVPSGGGSPSP
jgi:poly-gamma-glutamate synthesis protein (capsule biosynthesis protein)